MKPLRLLLVEDCDDDAEMLLRALTVGGYDVTCTRIETADAMREALTGGTFDLVVSDYTLPTFSAPDALELLKQTERDLPFIIVSGTVGEETAVAALKAGAHDFLVKGRPARLIPAIERELREAAGKRERARAQAELEEQLRQAQKMEAIGQLAGGIAHDFNNLLTAILGYCELLTDQVGTDTDIGRDVGEISAAAQRAAALTKQLLAFSRKQVLTMTPLDLNRIVRNLEAMLKRLIGERITIVTALDNQLPTVTADATQLEQVVLNLAVNARDAMPRGGILTIATKGRDVADPETNALKTVVSLTVADNGTGIAADIRNKIFEPFFTTKERGRGTGLGLAAVHGIITQLHGSIAVDSVIGHGTTFRIDLPASDAVEPQTVDPVEPAPAAGGETILLVEDEPGVRRFVSASLRHLGYQVLEAGSAEEALTHLNDSHRPIDLLLTDVVLKGMSGPELSVHAQQIHPSIHILFMSGYSEQIANADGFLEPGVTMIEKPFTSRALLTKIRELLDGTPSEVTISTSGGGYVSTRP